MMALDGVVSSETGPEYAPIDGSGIYRNGCATCLGYYVVRVRIREEEKDI